MTNGQGVDPQSVQAAQASAGLLTSNQLNSFVNENWFLGQAIAQHLRIDELSFKANVLLHLPRIITTTLPSPFAYERELWLIGKELEERQRPYLDWAQPPEQGVPQLKECRLVELSDDEARVFHERFHYVGSYRKNSVNFGLVCPQDNKIACMASFNNFDIANLTDKVSAIAKPDKVLLLSRSFAFRWAPRNAFSYMLKRALNAMRSKIQDLEGVVTYINPNLGFTGTQFNPLIWKPLALERGTRYSYVDGKYTTVRELISQFGTFESKVLTEMLGSRYVSSSVELEPLIVLMYALGRSHLAPVPVQPHVVDRPKLLTDIASPVSLLGPMDTLRAHGPNLAVGQTNAIDLRGDAKYFKEHSPRDIHERLAEWQNFQLKTLARAQEDKTENIRGHVKNIESLGEGDIFVYVSSVRPFEMASEDTMLRPAIAGALSRGATFLYVMPDDKCQRSTGDTLDWKSELQCEFQIFAARVLAHLPVELASRVKENLILIQAEDMSYFAVSGSKWDLYLTSNRAGEVDLHGGSMIPSNGLNVLMPLTSATAEKLLLEVAREVCRAHLKSLPSVPSNVAAGLCEKFKQFMPNAKDDNLPLIAAIEQTDKIVIQTRAKAANPGNRPNILSRLGQWQKGRRKSLALVKESRDGNIRSIGKNFDSMKEGDIFVYVSTMQPYEMSEQGSTLKPIIANALSRGVVLMYVAPKGQWLDGLGDQPVLKPLGMRTELQVKNQPKQHFVERSDMRSGIESVLESRVVSRTNSEKEAGSERKIESGTEATFEKFAHDVLSHLPADEATRVRKHLILIQSEDMPVFAVPGSKWDLFLTRHQNGEDCLRGGALIPAGPSSGMNVLLPQATDTAKHLLYAVARELQRKSADESAGQSDDVVAKLSERAEQVTGRKIAIESYGRLGRINFGGRQTC